MHHAHVHHAEQQAPGAAGSSLNPLAWSATLHCLTGCAIGEVLGMVIGTALGWGNLGTIALAAFPVNRWLIARGRGHAVAHAHH